MCNSFGIIPSVGGDPTVSSPKVAAVQAFFTTASIIDHYLAPGLLESSLSLLVFKLL